MNVLDIDLDFFVTPIKHWVDGDARLDDSEYSVDPIDSALTYLQSKCGLPVDSRLPGALFEHHDELFNYAISRWKEPVHLIHLDAHADIGGGLTRCWTHVCTEFTHLPQANRRFPRRGPSGLNCGNFIVFLAGCGLLERVTFVSHPSWRDDYNAIYMKDFDPCSEVLQLKRFSPETIENAGFATPLYKLPYEIDTEIPFTRISRDDFEGCSDIAEVFLTRSPGYTPSEADALFQRIAVHIQEE